MMEYKIEIFLCSSRTAHVHSSAFSIYMCMDFFQMFFTCSYVLCFLKVAPNVRVA